MGYGARDRIVGLVENVQSYLEFFWNRCVAHRTLSFTLNHALSRGLYGAFYKKLFLILFVSLILGFVTSIYRHRKEIKKNNLEIIFM